MRRVFNQVGRGVAAVVVIAALAGNVSASTARETRERGPREKANPIVKTVQKIIRVLGDGLTIPKP